MHDAAYGESATAGSALEDGMGFSRPVVGLALLAVVTVSACQSVGPSAAVHVSSATPDLVARSAAPTPAASATAVATAIAPSPVESISALSASVVSSTPLDIFPDGPAVGSNALWYWDGEAGRVVRLDATDGRAVATIAIGDPNVGPYGTPKTVAAAGDIVWVTDPSKYSVVRIDPKTNTVVSPIFLEAVINGTGATASIVPFGLAIDGSALWVSDFDQGVVIRVDPSSKSVTNVVTGLDHPEGIAVGFGSIWVVEHRTGTIARIDRTTATVTDRIALPGTGDQAVCGMCVDNVMAGHDSVWVPLNFGHGVARIDPTTNAVSATISLDGDADTVAEGNGAIWSAAWDGTIPCTDTGASVARIDPGTNAVSGTVVVPCAITVAVADGDVWVGTADAPNGVTRLRIQP
jgi:sugar lactone lactonase YvrE